MLKAGINILIAFIVLVLTGSCQTKQKRIILSFNSISSTDTIITAYGNSNRLPEFVAGVKGAGLRINGYSTWVEGAFAKPMEVPFSMSGWLALEAYPLDTAGFLAVTNLAENGICIGIDKFGYPFFAYGNKDSLQYITNSSAISKFEWHHWVLVIDTDSLVTLYLNGEVLLNQKINKLGTLGFNKFFAGRHFVNKILWKHFEVSSLNGIIDEIEFVDYALGNTEIKNEYRALKKQLPMPDLSIPSSRFENDQNRPKYHILPAANWTNESHGLVYYKGLYHIFNQKNANGLLLNNINWGHFSSPDLISWAEHRPVLSPEPGYDQIGIWSGHCVIDSTGKPVIMYTGGNGETFGMCLAHPNDDSLLVWTKYVNNPVVKGPPAQYSRIDFRDPYIFSENGFWYMMVGFGLAEGNPERGTVLLYKSVNLVDWTYLHPLFEGKPKIDDSGIFWEMPVFWKMGNKYVFLVNKVPQPGKPAVALYWVGDFVNEKFVPDFEIPKRLEIINRLLSPSLALDEKGRSVAIAIIPDEIKVEAQLTQGWTHILSIPRVWTLKNNNICQQPLPELASLRADSVILKNIHVSDKGKQGYLNVKSRQLEIIADIKALTCKRVGFVLAADSGKNEFTSIFYDFNNQQFVVDARKSSLNKYANGDIRTGNYKIEYGMPFKMHLFIDGSVAEVFINNEVAFTARFFPQGSESSHVDVFTKDGDALFEKVTIYNLNSSMNSTKW